MMNKYGSLSTKEIVMATSNSFLLLTDRKGSIVGPTLDYAQWPLVNQDRGLGRF